MNRFKLSALVLIAFGITLLSLTTDGFGQPEQKKDFDKKDFFKGGKGGPGGMFGGGERKIVKDFDKDKNGWLNQEDRSAARESIKNQGFGPKGFGGKMGFGKGNAEPPKPG